MKKTDQNNIKKKTPNLPPLKNKRRLPHADIVYWRGQDGVRVDIRRLSDTRLKRIVVRLLDRRFTYVFYPVIENLLDEHNHRFGSTFDCNKLAREIDPKGVKKLLRLREEAEQRMFYNSPLFNRCGFDCDGNFDSGDEDWGNGSY